MALLAGEGPVLPGERVARPGVVERLLPLLAPPDELVLDALVLDVAGLAVPVFSARMEPLSARHSLPQRLMAVQTLFRCHALVAGVAVEAVRAALELRVGPAQWAGRDLGDSRGRADRQRKREDAPDACSEAPALPSLWPKEPPAFHCQ